MRAENDTNITIYQSLLSIGTSYLTAVVSGTTFLAFTCYCCWGVVDQSVSNKHYSQCPKSGHKSLTVLYWHLMLSILYLLVIGYGILHSQLLMYLGVAITTRDGEQSERMCGQSKSWGNWCDPRSVGNSMEQLSVRLDGFKWADQTWPFSRHNSPNMNLILMCVTFLFGCDFKKFFLALFKTHTLIFLCSMDSALPLILNLTEEPLNHPFSG